MRYAVPLMVFAALAIMFAVALQLGDPSQLKSPLIGRPAPVTVLPAIAELPAPGLAAADLSQLAVVNVWASWCVPCIAEMPVLARMRAESGVPLLAINYKDAPANARRFLNSYGNPFNAIGADFEGRAGIEWGVTGVPETFLIAKDGTVAHRHAGPLSDDILNRDILPRLARLKAQ